MSSCPGLHCPGCGGAKVKITAGGVAALTAAIYYATHKQAIDHGADEFVHWLVITVVIVIAAAVAVVMTAAGIKTSLFIDPDGHPWEVAHNPHWTLTPDGGVKT